MTAGHTTPPFPQPYAGPAPTPDLARARLSSARALLAGFVQRLFQPVDIAALAYFRIGFGALMMVEIWRFFANGWIARYYIQPSFHFTYLGFEWVRPLPAAGMYAVFAALLVLAACMMVGIWYRIAAALFFLGFSYVFLLEQARYLNHFYLIGLVSFILIFLPADRAWSLTALRNPGLASQVAPAWTLWLLRLQIGIPYFFGGLAKLNPDWLQGEPMRIWLGNRADYPFLGPLVGHEATVALFSYGGLLLDLFAVPLLLWSRTRPLAILLTFSFHLLNAWLFRIGIFPWFMMAATLLFFPPSWPRRVISWIIRRPVNPPEIAETTVPVRLSTRERVVAGVLVAFVVGQLLLPFRHHLYPGEAIWTEEGSMFSWQMMLRHKPATLEFYAIVPSLGWTLQIDTKRYVTTWQFEEMDRRPDLILQLAHHIAEDLRKHGLEDVQIQVRSMAALNGRRRQPFIDPNVDLAAQPRTAWPPYPWIMPLTEPLRRPT